MTRARTSQNWLAALLAGMLLTGAQAQEVSTSPAQELMDAHAKFGLDLAHGEPFHLKLRLATFDESGKPTGSGSFEEFSDGKGRTRLMESHQLTGKSPWLVAPVDGDLTREPYFMRKGIEVFLRPLPSREELSSQSLEEKKTMLGSISVSCITAQPKRYLPGSAPPPGALTIGVTSEVQTYCLSADQNVLRLRESSPRIAVLYNKFHTFLAREIPYSVAVTQNRKVRATVEVETLDAWTPDEATLGSPTQAPAGGAFRVPGGVIAGGLLSKQQPVYPYLAKQNHIQGSVVLAAVISKQGTIQALELIDSPDESLTSASAEAVRHWRYKPYLLNGEPAEVDTTITVNFNFN